MKPIRKALCDLADGPDNPLEGGLV